MISPVGARAEGAPALVSVRIDAAAGLPFTSDQLGEAIRLRVDRARLTAPVVVSIERLDAASRNFQIGVGAKRCEVTIDPAPGPDAVRTVALLAVDLVESQNEGEPANDSEHERASNRAPPSRASRPAEVARPRSRWAASLEALGAPGGSWGDGKLEGHLEVSARLSRRWSASVAGGYGRLTRSVQGQRLLVDSVPVRAGIGLAVGPCDLTAAAALRLDRAGGTSGVISGGWLEARPALWRGATGKLALLVALELASERMQVRPIDSAPVFTSGYLTPWLGLALMSP